LNAKNKEKRREKHRKINKKISSRILSIILLCLIILGLFLLFFSHTDKSSPLLFEETYAVSSEINEIIGQVDYAIYESLFQKGVPEKDISFSKVIPRHQEGYDWDFTELLINLPGGDDAILLEDVIYKRLSELGPSIGVEKEKISDSERVCNVYNVYAQGLYTHKIRLINKEQEKRFQEGPPKIAIVIDDMGYDLDLAIAFMNLDLPLSLSVLPLAPRTADIAYEANRRGTELLLHLPMEPKDYPDLDPGPGAVLTNMDERMIRKTINNDIDQVPGIRGVNHHMGSKFTERSDKMKIVLRELKRRNLFYLDSRTTNLTVAYDLAKDMGVPAAKKDVFLDNDLSSKAIRFEMERLLGIARYSGIAIGIGHPHKETLDILKDYADILKTEFKVVPVSELVK
jgi:polysaccharide deacetylase 2 family uncharacterized protein YibQ